MQLTQDQAITNLVATYEGLKGTRHLRMTRVEAMRKYTFAAKSFLTNPLTGGENLYSGIYDRTGAQAATEFAANLFTHTTPSDQQWLLLSPPAAEPQLAEDRGYGRSLADLASRFQRAASETNFGTELHAAYEDLADGICCVDVAKPAGIGVEAKKAFVLTAPAMNEFCFLTDSSGRAHTIFSECAYTPYEAAKRFGEEKLPRALQDALAHLEASAYSQTQPFLNVMRPNEAWDPTALSEARYPYESLWIDLKTKALLQRGGLRRLRRVIARFRAARGQPWGWGPTDVAYAWIRALDKSTEIVLKYGAMKMNPPSIWPDDGAFYPQDAAPGTVIVGRLGATDRGTPSFLEVQGDHRVAQWLFDRMEALVMRAYMADIFTIFRDNKERTAREVATILQKSYDIIVPPLLRMKQELFTPLVLVCLELLLESELGIDGWMYAGKALPELRYDLELISPLFLAMRWGELQRLDDLVTLNSRLAEIDPAVWDNYTLDEMSRGIGDAMGVPQSWKRSDSAVRQIREARDRLLAQQRALEQTKLAGDAARGLGKGVEQNSPLAMMAGAA